MTKITTQLSAEDSAALVSLRAKRNRLFLLSLLAGVAMIFALGIWHIDAELRDRQPPAITGP